MDFLSHLGSALLCGTCFFAVYSVWHRSAARWSSWFPLVKKLVRWLLIGATVVLSFWAAGILLDAGAHLGIVALAFILGLAAPQLLLTYKFGASKDEKTSAMPGLATAVHVARKVRAARTPTQLSLGGVPIPVKHEPDNFLIAAATGAGKAAAMEAVLQGARTRGDTVIVVDAGGALLARHFRADTDFVFNTYDARCISWSPTAEMQDVADAQALARSMLPDGFGADAEATTAAQTFIAAVLRKLWESNQFTLSNLLYYVHVAPLAELGTLLVGTPAIGVLSDDRAFTSVRAIATAALRAYDSLPADHSTFSVAEMIRAEHSGVLFLSYRDDHLDNLRGMMACLLDIAARTILSLEPDADRRIWLVLDDAVAPGRVQCLESLAEKTRKFGGCLVLGIDSLANFVDQYGEQGAEALLSNLRTQLVLQCPDPSEAEYLANRVLSTEGKDSSQPTADAVATLSKRIQTLAETQGLLKLAGEYPVCSVKLAPPGSPEVTHAAFTARNFHLRPMLTLSGPAAIAPQPTPAEDLAPASSAATSRPPVEPPPASRKDDTAVPPLRARATLPRPPAKPETTVGSSVPSAFHSARGLAPAPQVEAVPVVSETPEEDSTPAIVAPADVLHTARESADETVASEPAAPVALVAEIQDAPPAETATEKPSKARVPKERKVVDASAPAIETLSSRRQRDEPRRSAPKPPAQSAEARIPAAASSRGSAKSLRDLLG